MSDAEAEPNPARSRTMVRGALAAFREVEATDPGSLSRRGFDVALFEQLAREVGDRGFLRDRKSIREAVADGSLSLPSICAMNEDDIRAYNEGVPLLTVMGIDRKDLT